jgi:hypothetical protein
VSPEDALYAAVLVLVTESYMTAVNASPFEDLLSVARGAARGDSTARSRLQGHYAWVVRVVRGDMARRELLERGVR